MPLKNTVVFWGAGATASLGMLTTSQQGELLYALSQKTSCETYAKCLRDFANVFGSVFVSVCDLLTLLDDDIENPVCGCRMSGFSQRQEDLVRRYVNELAGGAADFEQAKNRVIMMRLRYDWAAVMRILRVQRDDVSWNGEKNHDEPSLTFVQKVYNLIDANVSSGTGIHLFDGEDSEKSDFLDATRLRAAKSALIMFMSLCFAASWQSARLKSAVKGYKDFFGWLVELRLDRAKSEMDCRDVFDTRFVSMNFDPILWWFIKNADAEYNQHPKVIGDSDNCPLYFGEDFDHVDSVRPFKVRGSVSDDVLPESVARFVNRRGALQDERCIAKYQTAKIYFPHGSPNLKICPSCGKTTLYQGDELKWGSESLFPPFFLGEQTWCAHAAEPVEGVDESRSEKVKWSRGELDYIQCRHCGMGIRMCDTEMLVQSGLKSQPSWVLQRIAHNIDFEIMKARHIVLLGYSLPPDDALWVAELQSRKQRIHDRVYCSVVDYDKCLQDNGWLSGGQLDAYLHDENPRTHRALKSAVAVFGKENVRVNYKGFPKVVDGKDALFDMLYPLAWMKSTGDIS